VPRKDGVSRIKLTGRGNEKEKTLVGGGLLESLGGERRTSPEYGKKKQKEGRDRPFALVAHSRRLQFNGSEGGSAPVRPGGREDREQK